MGVTEVQVEVASSEAARRDGLRGYDSLAADGGLLLSFPGASEVCIVNDGVAFAIDAVFAEGGVVTATELAIDAGDGTPRCHRADAVLEVNVGAAAQVQVGDDFIVEL